MSLKSIAERLAEELAKTGKKLDRTVLHLAEAVDNIVGSIPKGQLTEKGFDSLPPTARKAMVDGLLKVTDAAPTPGAKKAIAQEYLNTFRIKFGEGKAGDDAFDKFGKQFAKALDEEMKGSAKPDLIRQAGGPVTNPRAPTPVSAEKAPTISIDSRRRAGEKDMGPAESVAPVMDKPRTQPKQTHAVDREDLSLAPKEPSSRPRERSPHVGSNEAADAAKLESARNKLSSLFIDLTSSLGKENVAGFFQMFKRNSPHMANAPMGPVANPQTSGDIVKKMIEFFATDEGKALPAKLGKLSPQATLDALRDGFRVDNASLQGMAEKLSQGKPLSFSERIARSPKSTVAAIALTAYSSLAGYDFFVKDTLGGMPLVQNLPPTVLMEWSDKATVGKSGEVLPGMDDYKPQVDWEILKATNNTSYRNLLIAGALSTMDPKLQQETRNMLSADILKDLPKPLASGSKDKEGFDPAQMNENQRIAGTAFIQRLTSGLKIVATEQQQNIAILESQAASVEAQKRAATAQAGLNNPEAIGQRMTFGQPESAAPAYDEYQVDGESFNNRVKGVTANNPGLYDDLAKAFKDATKMDVKPEEELTATNKLTKGEAALFAEQARDILAKRKVDTEKAEQIVQLLIEPSISSPALSR